MLETSINMASLSPAAHAARGALIFSGYVNPCRYIEVHRGVLGMNIFENYPGAENYSEIRQAVRDYCTLPARPRQAPKPWWYGALEERRAKFRLGVTDCAEGLRSSSHRKGPQAEEILDDFSLLAELFYAAGVRLSGFFVNLGAADGIWSDPLRHYARTVKGLAVEMDKSRCAAYRRNFRRSRGLVQVLCIRITGATLPVVASAVPIGGYDVLKIDLDSYDCDVLWGLLHRYNHRPASVLLEVNTAFPPPFEFAIENFAGWDRLNATAGSFDHLAYGCSLSYVVRLLTRSLPRPRYVLLQVVKKDALFLRDDVAEKLLGTRAAPDEFECYQANILEARAVEVQRLRRWFFGKDVQGILEEMRLLVRADLMRILGDKAGRQAPFHLSVGDDGRGPRARPSESNGDDDDDEVPAATPLPPPGTLAPQFQVVEPTPGARFLGFRDMVSFAEPSCPGGFDRSAHVRNARCEPTAAIRASASRSGQTIAPLPD